MDPGPHIRILSSGLAQRLAQNASERGSRDRRDSGLPSRGIAKLVTVEGLLQHRSALDDVGTSVVRRIVTMARRYQPHRPVQPVLRRIKFNALRGWGASGR